MWEKVQVGRLGESLEGVSEQGGKVQGLRSFFPDYFDGGSQEGLHEEAVGGRVGGI